MNESVEESSVALKKAAENSAKDHINIIWHNIENWSTKKLEYLLADLKKHV
jgi:hypothetical protein